MINTSSRLYHIGFSDGVNDCDNKEPNLILEESTHSDYGKFYLNGYKAGYENAADRSWFVVSLDKNTRKVKSYYIKLENGNSWTEDRSKATKFENKKVVYEELDSILSGLGRGEYSVVWEKNGKVREDVFLD